MNNQAEKIKECMSELIKAAQTKQNLLIQEKFNLLAAELLTTEFKFQDKLCFITDFEFASSIFDKNELHNHPLQKTLGNIYVHRYSNNNYKKFKYAGVDITCGNGIDFGALLIKGFKFGESTFFGSSNVLNILIGNEKQADNKHKYILSAEVAEERCAQIDGRDFFELFVPTKKHEDKKNEILLGRRLSFEKATKKQSSEINVDEQIHIIEEKSGCLLRAYSSPIKNFDKNVYVELNFDEINLPESEIAIVPEIQEEKLILELDNIVPASNQSSISKFNDSKTYNIAEKRYKSLVKRAFELRLDYFVYIKSYVQGHTELTVEMFQSFIPDEEMTSKVFSDYKNIMLLRLKNKNFNEFAANSKKLISNFKKHFEKEFESGLNFDQFKNLYYFSDDELDKRICNYCGISELELKSLFQSEKIKTKRQYSRGRSLEVDKIDPNDTYRVGNICLSCYWCNNAKSDEFDENEFKSIGQAIRKVWEERAKAN